MFKLLCLLLILHMAKWANCRPQPQNVVQQLSYLPYTDYDYLGYSGPGYYGQAYSQQYQHSYISPFYTPPATYFDQRRGILRPFPGGGVPVLVDYHKRCSNNFVGLKAHPEERQYYYVCKPDCVIFGKCQNLQTFNKTSGQCIQRSPPEYVPTCAAVGRFPIFSDCHLYYKCDEDLKATIFSCPAHMIFSPISQKCITGSKCTSTQISPKSSYLPEYCANKFPPCYESGTFRSPSDCSLYYRCELHKSGVYLQTRSRCPSGQFYDLKTSNCLPAEQVPCDCIQIAELVYPKTNGLPALYPAQFDLDLLEENIYPIEKTEGVSIDKCEKKVDDEKASYILEPTTAIEPFKPETKSHNFQINALLQADLESSEETTISLKEPDSSEGSGFGTTLTDGDGTDQFITTTLSSVKKPDNLNTITDTIQSVDVNTDSILQLIGLNLEKNTKLSLPEERTTTIFQEPSVIDEIIETTTGSASHTFTEEFSSSTSLSNSILKEISTTPASITIAIDTNRTTTSAIVFPRNDLISDAAQSLPCVITNEINNDYDDNLSGTKDTPRSKSQAKTCKKSFAIPTLNITKTRNTDQQQARDIIALVSEFTRGSRSTLVKQKITPITLTTHRDASSITKTVIDNSVQQREDVGHRSPSSKKNEENVLMKLESERNLIVKPKSAITTSKLANQLFKNQSVDQLIDEDVIIDNERSLEHQHVKHELKSLKKTTMKDKKLFTEDSINENIAITGSGNAVTSQKNMSFNLAFKNKTQDQDVGLLDSNMIHENFKSFSKALLNKDLFSIKPKQNDRDFPQDDDQTKTSIFSEEQLLPVHSKITVEDELPEQATDFDYITNNPNEEISFDIKADYDDLSTNTSEIEQKPKPFSQLNSSESLKPERGNTENILKVITAPKFLPSIHADTNSLKLGQNMSVKSLPTLSSQITLAPKPADGQKNDNFLIPEEDPLNVKDVAEIELTVPILLLESTSPQPHTALLNTATPTQMPTTTTHTPPTIDRSVKQTHTIQVQVREHQTLDSQDSNKRNEFFFILKTEPVNKPKTAKPCFNINDTITENNDTIQANSENLPRLEIIAERPIDVRFKICPSNCHARHEHKFAPNGNRAVFVRWFSNKSNQTLGFEAANEVNIFGDGEKDFKR